MQSVTTEKFRECYKKLPKPIKEQTRIAYSLWRQSPYHPSLHFKLIHQNQAIYSVRIGLKWRALGIKKEDTLIWF